MKNFFLKLNSDVDKIISKFFKEQQDALHKFNSEIENTVSLLFKEHQKLFAENELLNVKLKEFESELNNREIKINDTSKINQTNKSIKRLFSNLCTSSNILKDEEILVKDTCDDMFDRDDRNYRSNNRRGFDGSDDDLSIVLETEFQYSDNGQLKPELDPFEIDTQISEEEDIMGCASRPTDGIDSDETVLDYKCDDNDTECQITVVDREHLSPSMINLDETVLECENSDEDKENVNHIDIGKNADKSIKYVGSTIRKKVDRQELKGFDCIECKQYYGALGVTDSQIIDRIQQCSRHRAKYVPPSTPEGYWDIGRVTTEIPRDDNTKLKGRRTKKLQLPKRKWIRL